MSTTPAQTIRELASRLSALRARMTERRLRRQAGLDGLMGMNDRALADIGVRRADVQATMAGIVPAGRIGARPTPTARVHTLRPEPCRQRMTVLANDDLIAAA